MNKKPYYIWGCILLVAALVFGGFALTHPELSFPWPNAVTYTIYVVYVLYTVLIFLMPRMGEPSPWACFFLALEFTAIVLLAMSICTRKTPDEGNWYLPAALAINCFALLFNSYITRKKKKS